MSYDFWIEDPTGRHDPEFDDCLPAFEDDGMAGTVVLTASGYTRCGNYTSNVAPIWARCLSAVAGTEEEIRLADFEGRPCGTITGHLAAAVEWGVEHIDELCELNPPNGWGNAEGAVTYLWDIQRMCERHPDGRLAFWR